VKYIVYVIQSETTKKIYIGQTNDFDKRLKQHNDKTFDIRSYTKLQGDSWKLKYKEEYNKREEAITREKQLKSHKGRDWIKNNILGR